MIAFGACIAIQAPKAIVFLYGMYFLLLKQENPKTEPYINFTRFLLNQGFLVQKHERW